LIPLCERTVIAGKYRLERELASGGMGAVWVARHLQLDELVAVKFMSATLPELADARARFAREARSAALLRSPHVVQVLDHGVDGDLPYIVMELLSGEHLGDRLKRSLRLSLRDASIIAGQVGKALGRAHRAGIVHRDLKPANVFLARLDDEEIVKILDFGIAKNLADEGPRLDVTGGDLLMGSPQYMSPEQARGSRAIDQRADLWSLGAILFRAVTGVPAFEGASAVDVIVQICTGAIPLASRAAPDLSPDVDAFFFRALARDPARRFASAREMTEAFASLVPRLDAGVPSSRSSQPRESGEELSTSVMARQGIRPPPGSRRGQGPQTPGRLGHVAGASPAEIDAFVERAFSTLLGGSPPPLRAVADLDSVPPTTRCPPLRSGAPPPLPEGRSEPSSGFTPSNGTSSLLARLAEGRVTRSDPPAGIPAPGAVGALIDQGLAALRRGEPDRARRAWREALGLDPSNRMLALHVRRLEAMRTAARRG
jgi:eukaryotic-like serine/threonine-protein kinase